MNVVNLKELIEGMSMQFEEFNQYVDKRTGQLIMVSDEEFSIVEESEEDDDFRGYPEDERENVLLALDVMLNWNEYIKIPDKYDIDEYKIMESFCDAIENDGMRDRMSDAIIGRGAFGRFKEMIDTFGIVDDWYRFREEALKDIAIDWCEDHGIGYAE